MTEMLRGLLCVSVGCGPALWEFLLQRHGVRVECYDHYSQLIRYAEITSFAVAENRGDRCSFGLSRESSTFAPTAQERTAAADTTFGACTGSGGRFVVLVAARDDRRWQQPTVEHSDQQSLVAIAPFAGAAFRSI